MNLMKKIPIFLHIPKTGGTTLRDIINRQYKSSQIYTIATLKESENFHEKNIISTFKEIKIIRGHLKYGFHNKINIEPVYFTILRNPVERVLSTYYYVLSNKNNPQNLSTSSKYISIYEFIESGINPFLMNGQTQLLAGLTTNVYDPAFHSEELYQIAKTNLENNFIFVGLTEMFDESVVLIKKILNWKTPYYSSANRTKKKPDFKKITLDERTYIENHNQLDLKLFNFAKNMLINEINKGGQELQDEITKFKKTNKVINPIFGYSRAKRFFYKLF